MKKKAGFTLVEIIVTLVILGVVIGIAVPAFVGFIKKGHRDECVANRESLIAYYLTEKVIKDSQGKAYSIEDEIKNRKEIACPSRTNLTDNTYTGKAESGYVWIDCKTSGHGSVRKAMDGFASK